MNSANEYLHRCRFSS